MGHNLFTYSQNNPVNMSDPNGYRPIYTMGEETDKMREASFAAMAISSKFSNSKSITKTIKKTQATGLGAAAASGARFEASVEIVKDENNGYGIYLTIGFGGGTPAAGLSGNYSTTNASNYNDISGLSADFGGSVAWVRDDYTFVWDLRGTMKHIGSVFKGRK